MCLPQLGLWEGEISEYLVFSSTYYVLHVESTSRHSQRTYCVSSALGTLVQASPMLGEVALYTVLPWGELRYRLEKGQITQPRELGRGGEVTL